MIDEWNIDNIGKNMTEQCKLNDMDKWTFDDRWIDYRCDINAITRHRSRPQIVDEHTIWDDIWVDTVNGQRGHT